MIVIGETVRRELFGDADPIGEPVRIGDIGFEVIGVLAPKGQSPTGQDQDDTVMMPWTTAMKRIVGKDQTWLDSAVGARPSAIQLQFLGEAVVLSLLGGVLGVALGEGSAYAFEHQLGWTLAMSPEISAVAVVASIGVGVVFGLYPAVRAARVDPIVALRTE